MDAVSANNLSKNFSIKIKEKGLKNSIKSIFFPTYKTVNAVKHITFNIKEKERVGFIGPNGAGKSTTIKMLTGILQPTDGQIKVLGYNPSTDRNKLLNNIGAVYGQRSQLYYNLTVMDNMLLIGTIYELSEKEIRNTLDTIFGNFDLSQLMNIPVRKLSLGQRMKCEVIASFLHKPKVIFLDEPTIGLDFLNKNSLRNLIIKINEEFNTTIFLTSHDIEDIEEVCNRVIIINKGELVEDEPLATLKSDYSSKRIIKISYKNPIDTCKLMEMQNFEYLDIDKFNLKIELDLNKDKINTILQIFDSAGEISDISINAPPLEEIISDIYKN